MRTTISQANLIEVLKRTKKSTIVSILSLTSQNSKLVKPKSNPFNGLEKLSRHKGYLNIIPQNSINRGLKKLDADLPEYKTRETWFTHLTECRSLVAHKTNGNLYLFFKLGESLTSTFVHGGKRYSKNEISEFLVKERENHYTAKLGIEPEIFLTIAINNVKRINIDNKKYVVED